MKRIANEEDTQILGYCLMDNHVHILLRDETENKRLNNEEAKWVTLSKTGYTHWAD